MTSLAWIRCIAPAALGLAVLGCGDHLVQQQDSAAADSSSDDSGDDGQTETSTSAGTSTTETGTEDSETETGEPLDPACEPAPLAGYWSMTPSQGTFVSSEVLACQVTAVAALDPEGLQLGLGCPDIGAVEISIIAATLVDIPLMIGQDVALRVDWSADFVGIHHVKVQLSTDDGLVLGLYDGGPEWVGGFGSQMAMPPLSFSVHDDCPLDQVLECGESEHLVIDAWIDPEAPVELWPDTREALLGDYQILVDHARRVNPCQLHSPPLSASLIVARVP